MFFLINFFANARTSSSSLHAGGEINVSTTYPFGINSHARWEISWCAVLEDA